MKKKLDVRQIFSIITPSKNQGHYIEETITSIIKNIDTNFEYIVIDGKSNDNTVAILNKYNERIAHWESKKDKGQSHAINKGLRMAKGEYATWINSDDLLAPNGLKNIIAAIKKYPNTDLFVGKNLVLVENGQLQDKTSFLPTPLTLAHYLGSFPYSQPACFFRLDTVKELGFLDEQFHFTMDMDLFLRIVLSGGIIKRIDKEISIFRKQPGAKTQFFSEQWERERNLVLSKYLRSIGGKSDIINNLTNMNIYINGKEIYKVNINITNKQLNQSVEIFLHQTIYLLFISQRYSDAYRHIIKMEKFFPLYINSWVRKMKIKSYLSIAPVPRFLLNKSLNIFRKIKTIIQPT